MTQPEDAGAGAEETDESGQGSGNKGEGRGDPAAPPSGPPQRKVMLNYADNTKTLKRAGTSRLGRSRPS
eukprot:Nitzschia sp. Nitz4//scaffold16_size188269//127246//127452//NITZ4_001804-RA/size188269-processed-gene-0.105-mRNA-1//-1//CDS//3329538556//2652//frame0